MPSTESTTHQPGDVVNGHQLSADGTTWLPVEQAGPATSAQTQQGNWFARHKVLTVIGAGAAAILLIVGITGGGSSKSQDSTAAVAQETTDDPAVVTSEKSDAEPAEEPAAEPAEEPAAEPTEEPAEPTGTVSQQNALRSANNYLTISGFSRIGLIKQLSSEYGDGYSKKDATWAVDQLDTNWNEQAVRSAKVYLELSGFSRSGLIEQLSSEYGDQYTVKQATYAADAVGL